MAYMNPNNLNIDKYFLSQLNQKQKEIGELLLDCNLEYTNNVGIMNGLAGIGLTLSLYYRITLDERFINKLEQTIEVTNKKIYIEKKLDSSYVQGIAGYAWLIIYLQENNILDVDIIDYLADIDIFLYQELMFMLDAKQYDSLYESVGLGFYFLKRKKTEVIEQIIAGLYNNRKNIKGYATWIRKNPKSNKEEVDFGLSHGLPGILFFLHKCYVNNISHQKCSEMIQENIAFMFTCMNFSGTPSYLPYTIECDKIKQYDIRKNWSRLAWCYGDLSALYILYLLSFCFSTPIDIIGMLEHVAKRRNEEMIDVRNPGICHGTSGIALIFLRLFLKTGNHGFEEACHYWLKRTLSLGNNPTGIVGFVFPENHNNQQLDLLTGISGIGSVLISFLNPKFNSWDESIFLT